MSTVALRGTLKYDETINGWVWAGRWVFGDSVPPLPDSNAKKSHKKKIIARPFSYRLRQQQQLAASPVEPSKIPVPSLNVRIVQHSIATEASGSDERRILVERSFESLGEYSPVHE